MSSSVFVVPRDGRSQRADVKTKNIFALERFMGKAAGFMGTSDDKTLEALGLGYMLLSHQHRFLACLWAMASKTCLVYPAKNEQLHDETQVVV